MKNYQAGMKILVCAPSNSASDLLAERLFSVLPLQSKIIRYQSTRKEDIFNVNPYNVRPYTLLSKILFMSEDRQKLFRNEIALDAR